MSFFAVKKEGQGGIISCIAFSPDSSGMYALGSYSKSGTMILWKYEIRGWNDVLVRKLAFKCSQAWPQNYFHLK